MNIAAHLKLIRANIDETRQSALLKGYQTALMGACKGQNAAVIIEAIQNGVTLFGENRVQEACEKWPELKKSHPNVALHLIGPLQTNKVKEALALFDVIQSLDRVKLAEALARELGMRGLEDEKKKGGVISPHPLIPSSSHPTIYIQINTGCEPQKSGVIPNEADDFIRYCMADLKLPVIGLMCVPPADQPAAPHFALLYEIAARHGLKELSMGMSGDYEAAVRMGSTCVRIGTGLFGGR